MTEGKLPEGEVTIPVNYTTGRGELFYYAADMEEVGRILTDEPTAKVILTKSGKSGDVEYSEIMVTYDPDKNQGAATPATAIALYGNAHYSAYYAK